jgi:peptide/nickel transport system permease protein
MSRFIRNRVGQAIGNLLFIATIVFVLVRLTGSPINLLVPEYAPESLRQKVTSDLGLDKPVWEQYARYLWGLLHFDFGVSYASARPVGTLLMDRMMATAELSLAGLAIAVVIGVPLGVVAAIHKGKLVDVGARTTALLGQSTPSFYLSILLILIFAVELGLFPVAGKAGPTSFVLPAIALAGGGIAGIVRLTRSSLLDVLDTDYIRMARAKGMPPRVVVVKHAMRNSIIPVLTFIGIMTGRFLGGAVIIESIFNWPGVGQLTLIAVQTRDFPVVQGAVILTGLAFILVNLIVDLLYAVIDPRIRHLEGAVK